MRRLWIACFALALFAGCGAGAYVTKDPGRFNKGLRFYRPKPYVLLQPVPDPVGASGAAKGSEAVDPAGRVYRMSLEYLPDFEEEYAVRVRPGLGTAKVNVTLENGWNLTGLTQDLDSKTAENLTAFANVVKAGAPGGLSLKNAGDAAESAAPAIPAFMVRGRNVPIGYYESVLTRDREGRKHLAGFRYVGFAPFGAPLETLADCRGGGVAQLYGLMAENGELAFRPLPEVEAKPLPDERTPPPPPMPTIMTDASKTQNQDGEKVAVESGSSNKPKPSEDEDSDPSPTAAAVITPRAERR